MKISEYGMIEISVARNPLGVVERYDYKWTGGPIIEISLQFLDFGPPHHIDYNKNSGIVKIGPYRLRVIEEEFWYNRLKCVIEKYPLWRLVFGWHRISRLMDIAYRRFIITLAVWRLAKYDPATIPHWKDIYILSRVNKWIKK